MLARAIREISTPSERRLIDAQHELRAKVFAGRMGWSVHVENGRETDEFDALGPTYILVIASSGTVVGCARLLPTTGPTMLAHRFPQLLKSGRLEADPTTAESSRFCVDTSLSEGRAGGLLHKATLTMFTAIIEWSMANGYTKIVTATDLRFERILKRAGWPMRRLGASCEIGKTIAVAGSLPTDEASFQRVRPSGYRSAIQATHWHAA